MADKNIDIIVFSSIIPEYTPTPVNPFDSLTSQYYPNSQVRPSSASSLTTMGESLTKLPSTSYSYHLTKHWIRGDKIELKQKSFGWLTNSFIQVFC